MHLSGMRARAGRDRIKPWLEFFQKGNELLRVAEIGGMVDDEIDQITAPAEFVVGFFVVRRHERAQEWRAASSLPFLDDRLVQRADVVVTDECLPQGNLATIRGRHFARLAGQVGDDFIHHQRRIDRIDAQRVADLVGQIRVLE